MSNHPSRKMVSVYTFLYNIVNPLTVNNGFILPYACNRTNSKLCLHSESESSNHNRFTRTKTRSCGSKILNIFRKQKSKSQDNYFENDPKNDFMTKYFLVQLSSYATQGNVCVWKLLLLQNFICMLRTRAAHLRKLEYLW